MGRERHAAAVLLQQLQAQKGFKPRDLLADRAGRDAQRAGGEGDAFVARHGIEGQQFLDGGTVAFHIRV
ncbi:hypothetical protein D3C86_2099930 [compost metagenome]